MTVGVTAVAAIVLLSACHQYGLDNGLERQEITDAESVRCRPYTGDWAVTPSAVSWMNSHSDAIISPPVNGQTLRQFIGPHLQGEVIRLRISNRYATTSVQIENVFVAERSAARDASVVKGSECALTFDGNTAITLMGGESVTSDPIHFSVRPFTSLGISFFVPGAPVQMSRHFEAQDTLYVSTPGDFSADASNQAYNAYPIDQANNWVLIEALEVQASHDIATIVTIGDSITDGTASGNGRNQRYPDALQKRLFEAGREAVVINSGIGGNQLTRASIPQFGPPLLERFNEDALNISNASTLLVMIGTNDLGINWIDPTITEAVLEGYASLIEQAHARGKRIILGTIPPAHGYPAEQVLPQGSPGYFTVAIEPENPGASSMSGYVQMRMSMELSILKAVWLTQRTPNI